MELKKANLIDKIRMKVAQKFHGKSVLKQVEHEGLVYILGTDNEWCTTDGINLLKVGHKDADYLDHLERIKRQKGE